MKLFASVFLYFSPICFFLFFSFPSKAQPVTIVIDPGHGGENMGGMYGEYVEKEMTMATAKAMKEELENYNNVTVYLTHDNTTDPDMSLKKRAKFAASVHADFLFSIHYNMSLDHRLYGAEVWTSAFGNEYAKGTSFAQIEMESLTAIGLCDRGIKTRLNDRGTDYYGIIREAREVSVPCVIIEHCHIDEKTDIDYLKNGMESCRQFGLIDADAVARYFRLSSDILSKDYRDYPLLEVSVPSYVQKPDATPPEQVSLSLVNEDFSLEYATVSLHALDLQTRVLYYDYSLDGGKTYSSLFPWNGDENIFFSIPLKQEQQTMVCRVYNIYDRFAASNEITLLALPEPKQEQLSIPEETIMDFSISSDIQEQTEYADTDRISDRNQNSNRIKDQERLRKILFSLLILLAALTMIYNVYLFILIRRRKNHKKKRK